MPSSPLLKRLLSEWLPALLLGLLAIGIWWYFNSQGPAQPGDVPPCPTPVEVRLPGQMTGRYVACTLEELEEVLQRTGIESDATDARLNGLFEREVCPCRVTLSPDGTVASLEEGTLSGSVALALGLPIDVNRASAGDLEALPGVGPKVAQAIVDDRREHGPYCAVAELNRVKGIGEKFIQKHQAALKATCP